MVFDQKKEVENILVLKKSLTTLKLSQKQFPRSIKNIHFRTPVYQSGPK